LRVSLRTYLPVKPDAPRIIRSNFFVTFGSIFCTCFEKRRGKWFSSISRSLEGLRQLLLEVRLQV
jgi:hypothetical protein